MAKNNVKYDIKITRYMKKPTGRKNQYGNAEYVTVGEPVVKIKKNTNFAELKKDLYKQSKQNNNVFVNYSRPAYVPIKLSPKVKSVTVRYANGSKQVSYYEPVKKH